MNRLSLGVIGTSAKENEHRLPIHPEHLPRLAPETAQRTTLEHGYAAHFGVSDDEMAPHVAGFASREEILTGSDVVVLPSHSTPTWRACMPARCCGVGRTASRTRR